MANTKPPHIVILAAGAAKRMRLEHPEALHPVFFRPMIHYVLDAAMAIPHRSVTLVVGRGEREFREQCRSYRDLHFVQQAAGTAAEHGGDILVLRGEVVLLEPRTLVGMLTAHAGSRAACTVGRADPGDAPAAYYFRELPAGLGELELAEAARSVGAAEFRIEDRVETMAIDDLHGLWRVEAVLQERFNRSLMLQGVALQDPRATLIDPRCRIARGVRIEGGCTVINSVLESGACLENYCRIADSEIGPGSLLRQGSVVERARVGRDCRVGPYARLGPGARLHDDVWIGNFVEIMNASLGPGTRAAHQCFIGDALVGRKVGIGAGFITCASSAGPAKQRTIIGDEVFIGGASHSIAPVTLGAGSFIASGTSVNEDAPAGSFVISRGRQVTKPDYAKKHGRAPGSGATR